MVVLLLQAALVGFSLVSAAMIQLPQSALPADINTTTSPYSNRVANTAALSSASIPIPNNRNNTPALTLNASNTMLIHCDAMMFGHSLHKQDCLEAIASVPPVISPAHVALSFGDRDARHFDIGLPRRYLSNNGLCAIQPRLVRGAKEARLTPIDADRAAIGVVDQCVDREVSTGGIAGDIGKLRMLWCYLGSWD